MNNKNIDLLNLCLKDSLFAALYEALCNLEAKWQTPSPADMWVEALSARHELSKSNRPDLLLRQLFADTEQHEAVIVEALLIWILFNEDRSTKESPLKDALAKILQGHGEDWDTVYSEFRESESRNEQAGFNVCQTDYRDNAVSTELYNRKQAQDAGLAQEMVSYALERKDLQSCRDLYYVLSRIDYQKGHVYNDMVIRLGDMIDKLEKADHEPRNHIENNFEQGSCTFNQGSSLNGDIVEPITNYYVRNNQQL